MPVSWVYFARAALPILQQGICRQHCLGVFFFSHEECVALLLFQDGVLRVIRMPNKKTAAELLAGGCHRLLFVLGPNEEFHRRLVFIPMLQHEPLPVFFVYAFMVHRLPAKIFYRVLTRLKNLIVARVYLLCRLKHC